jgi:hypothetical protein
MIKRAAVAALIVAVCFSFVSVVSFLEQVRDLAAAISGYCDGACKLRKMECERIMPPELDGSAAQAFEDYCYITLTRAYKPYVPHNAE